VLNEKFGDGIMSAISFSTNVKKETDDAGNPWVVITLRGKWYIEPHLKSWSPRMLTNSTRLPFTRF